MGCLLTTSMTPQMSLLPGCAATAQITLNWRISAGHVDVPGPVKPVIPDRPGKVVHALKVLQAAFVVYVVFLAIFVKWLKPGFLSLFSSILLGVGLGIGYSFLQNYYKKRQAELSALVSLQPRDQAMQLPTLPASLLSRTEHVRTLSYF